MKLFDKVFNPQMTRVYSNWNGQAEEMTQLEYIAGRADRLNLKHEIIDFESGSRYVVVTGHKRDMKIFDKGLRDLSFTVI